jgi:hypothetical protein
MRIQREKQKSYPYISVIRIFGGTGILPVSRNRLEACSTSPLPNVVGKTHEVNPMNYVSTKGERI